MLEQLRQNIKTGGDEPEIRFVVFRRKQAEHQRDGDAGKELHPRVKPQIVEAHPDQQADDAERHQRPEQQLAGARIDPFLDHIGEDRHERKRHWQAIPEQTPVARRPMVIGRSEAGQEYAEKEDAGGQAAAHMHEAERTNQNERQVGHHAPEMRNAEQRPLIGEAMVNLALRDWRNEQKRRQRNRGKAEQKSERARPHSRHP